MERLSKEVKRNLRKIAKNLPVCYDKSKKVLQSVKGSTLIDAGLLKAKDKSDIKPEKYYVCPVSKEINHYNELEKVFKEFGQSGVETYIKAVYASIHNVEVKETEEAA